MKKYTETMGNELFIGSPCQLMYSSKYLRSKFETLKKIEMVEYESAFQSIVIVTGAIQ